MKKTRKGPVMRKEYDFRGAVRGKHAKHLPDGSVVAVVLAPDVAEVFKDSQAVNEALRTLLRLRRAKRRSAS